MARFDTDKATRFGLGLRFSAVETLEFLDYGGCNILHHVSSELSASVDPIRFAAPTIVGRMFEQGLLGLKSGHGFYDFRAGISRPIGAMYWRAPFPRLKAPDCGGRQQRRSCLDWQMLGRERDLPVESDCEFD